MQKCCLTWTKLFFSFEGRISRRMYLWSILALQLIVVSVLLVSAAIVSGLRGEPPSDGHISGGTVGVLICGGVIMTALCWVIMALYIKRLHDRNRSGWWLLAGLIIYLGLEIVAATFHLGTTDGSEGSTSSVLIILIVSAVSIVFGLWISIELVFFSGKSVPNKYGQYGDSWMELDSKSHTIHSFWRFKIPASLDYAFIPTLLIAVLIFRSFITEPFNIPSTSMLPTLLVGDNLFVSKYSYGYDRYSCTICATFFTGRIFEATPKRGDVVVFRLPRDPTVDYIKRVVGLPGDHIQLSAGQLIVNGEPAARERTGEFLENATDGRPPTPAFRETLADGTSYMILQRTEMGPLNNTQEYIVPPGQLFMLGDNRDNSLDSRISSQQGGVGFVPLDNLVGRAEFRWFSTASDVWLRLGAIRWSRVLTEIR